tara:strand:+ start:1698 stop:4589 length:2892 start_codon:yes stop_codon:yes gene_type:complete
MKRLFCVLLIYFSLALLSFNCFSKPRYIEKVNVFCQVENTCQSFKVKIEKLLLNKVEVKNLKRMFRTWLMNEDIESFYYEVFEFKNKNVINVHLKSKRKIGKISVSPPSMVDFEKSIFKTIPFKKSSFFSKKLLVDSVSQILNIFVEKGYRGTKVEPTIKRNKNTVDLDFKIILGKEIEISKINIEINDKEKNILNKSFKKWIGKRWDSIKFKIFLEKITKDFFSKGFYNFSISIKKIYYNYDQSKVFITLKGHLGGKRVFYFQGNKYLNRSQILGSIEQIVSKSRKEIGLSALKKVISNLYEESGIYNSDITISLRKGKTKEGLSVNSFFCYINEGKKVKLDNIKFSGSKDLKQNVISDLFFKNGTPLIKGNFLDKKYLQSFIDILKEDYYRRGRLFVSVSSPLLIFNRRNNTVSVSYNIREGNQIILKKFNINKITNKLNKIIFKEISNKVGKPINIVEIKNDLSKILKIIKGEGYFFAKIKNLNLKNLVTYQKNYQEATINLSIDLGKKTVFDRVLITGNRKTKKEVILREINLEKGGLVTPILIKSIKENLSSLGIFSAVTVTPFEIGKINKDGSIPVDLVISVKEEDSIQLTLAPGYRTDIGVKLSSELKFSNFQGMNRSLIMKAQTNQRLDFNNLDSRRFKEEKRLLEFSLKASFFEPYFLNTPLEFEGVMVASRKRQRGFDADFLKTSLQVNKVLSSKLSYSLKYQLEAIKQFDATLLKDQGNVTIGSLTPSISYDFRKTKINTREGGIFGLSLEYASPTFFSTKTAGEEVNYIKLTSRNRYYINRGNLVYAFSASFGFQKNLATNIYFGADGKPVIDEEDGQYKLMGFIPSIKVFSLSGVDSVRGFSLNEINRLESGKNIGEVILRDRAYFSNVKFEPRYYFNDRFAASLFVDGGRLYVGKFNFFAMRFGVGLGAKLLTPVGSLDFDYGFKLNRKDLSDGQREELGRFHLSIGFF